MRDVSVRGGGRHRWTLKAPHARQHAELQASRTCGKPPATRFFLINALFTGKQRCNRECFRETAECSRKLGSALWIERGFSLVSVLVAQTALDRQKSVVGMTKQHIVVPLECVILQNK